MGKNVLMIAVMALFLAVFGAFYFQDRSADQNPEAKPVELEVYIEKPQPQLQPQTMQQKDVMIQRLPPQPSEPKPLAPALDSDLTIFGQDMPPQP